MYISDWGLICTTEIHFIGQYYSYTLDILIHSDKSSYRWPGLFSRQLNSWPCKVNTLQF